MVRYKDIQHRIDVIDEDIELGEVQSKTRCAIARATLRCIPGATRVHVDNEKAVLAFTLPNGDRMDYELKDRSLDFVRKYDRGEPVTAYPLLLTEADLLRRRPKRVVARKPRARKPVDPNAPKRPRKPRAFRAPKSE